MHVSEQANDFCNKQLKKTVCPEHVLDALTVSLLSTDSMATHNWLQSVMTDRLIYMALCLIASAVENESRPI